MLSRNPLLREMKMRLENKTNFIQRSFVSLIADGNSNQTCKNDIYRSNLIITTYFRQGNLEAAAQVFKEMPQRNIVTWNCMISGYIRNRRIIDAHHIFDSMPSKNTVSWTSMLNGYARCGMLEEACKLFDAMPERNIVSWNSLISGYIKNGKIDKARDLFDSMPQRNSFSWSVMIGGYMRSKFVVEARLLFDRAPEKTTSLYNTMLAGYVHLGRYSNACDLFERMLERDIASYTTMIACYSQCGKMEAARRLFDQMPDRDLTAWTVILRGYTTNGDTQSARSIFDKIPNRDIICCNTMISGYVQNGLLGDALQLFMEMPHKDIVTWNSILQGHVQNGDVRSACDLFSKMSHRDETSWNIMISGCQDEEALILYSRMMRERFRPDEATFKIVISTCASLAALSWGRMMHLCVIRLGYEHDTTILSSLVTMYSKCGLMSEARCVFQGISVRDTVAWNAMIVAKAYHGSPGEAHDLFSSMVQAGCTPDHVTFLGLLIACSHKGLIGKGLEYFYSMYQDWKITPRQEHYACMVDILGRFGLLNEAYNFIKKIPAVLCSVNTLETLLGACRIHGNLHLGELLAKRILKLDPSNQAVYLLLSQIHASNGLWEDSTKGREIMKKHGIKKEAACSWIEIKGVTNTFGNGDRFHPQMYTIHNYLKTLRAIMKELILPNESLEPS